METLGSQVFKTVPKIFLSKECLIQTLYCMGVKSFQVIKFWKKVNFKLTKSKRHIQVKPGVTTCQTKFIKV